MPLQLIVNIKTMNDALSVLLSLGGRKIDRMNSKAAVKNMPPVIRTHELFQGRVKQSLNKDYRLVLIPKFGIPPFAFKVIYKTESQEETVLGYF